MGQFQLAFAMGCFCYCYLLFGILSVLVGGLTPRFCDVARSCSQAFSEEDLQLAKFRLERARQRLAMLLLAGITTPLVISVHTIVSFDFATSVVSGWHTTIFPPYFVAGAIFSGFAMVSLLLTILRKVCKLEAYITLKHIELMNTVMLLVVL